MTILLHPAAVAELGEAAAFYAEQADKALGLALVAEFERALALLASNPELGAAWRSGTRRLSLRRFPYSVVYRLSSDTIQVIAIAHQRRRPGYWQKRR